MNTVQRRQEKDRGGLSRFANLAQNLEAVLFWKHAVQHHQLVVTRLGHGQSIGSGVGQIHLIVKLFEPSFQAVPAWLAARARPGDVVLTLGDGIVTTLAPEILELLSVRAPS